MEKLINFGMIFLLGVATAMAGTAVVFKKQKTADAIPAVKAWASTTKTEDCILYRQRTGELSKCW